MSGGIRTGLLALAAAITVTVGGLSTVAGAQEFPSRPMKLVVGFGPGGVGDIVARAVAQKMSESLGKPMVVENMPGAGGITAASAVAKSTPDGHTLLLISSQNAISPYLLKSLPYDVERDFAMVSTMSFFEFVVIADKASALKTVRDVTDTAKRDPAHFNMGTVSVGTLQYLSALLFQSLSGVKVPVVPFKSTGDVITGLKADEVQVGFETLPGVIGQIRSGEMRALAVASDKPVALLPGVPTVAETVKGYNAVSWNGLVVPGKTPRAAIDRLNKAVVAAIAAPDLRERFAGLGIDPRAGTPEDMKKVYEADAKKWHAVIIQAKIEPQ